MSRVGKNESDCRQITSKPSTQRGVVRPATDLEDPECIRRDLLERTRDKLVDAVRGIGWKGSKVDVPLKGGVVKIESLFNKQLEKTPDVEGICGSSAS
jgi:hypothetical protein